MNNKLINLLWWKQGRGRRRERGGREEGGKGKGGYEGNWSQKMYLVWTLAFVTTSNHISIFKLIQNHIFKLIPWISHFKLILNMVGFDDHGKNERGEVMTKANCVLLTLLPPQITCSNSPRKVPQKSPFLRRLSTQQYQTDGPRSRKLLRYYPRRKVRK